MAAKNKTGGKTATPEGRPEENPLFQAAAQSVPETKSEPVAAQPEPGDNAAGLSDVMYPLHMVLSRETDAGILSTFRFVNSQIVDGKKVAHYQFGNGGPWLIADEEGTCYAELESGYEPIAREVAL